MRENLAIKERLSALESCLPPPKARPDGQLTAKEVASVIDAALSSVYARAAAGKIKSTKVDGRRWFDPASLTRKS